MIREIAPRIFVETEYHGANVAFVVTGEGVILIDTPMLPNEARAWLAEIQRRTDEPILYIINTDHHRAHVIGDQHFPMAKVIAHEHAWKEMKSYGDSFRTRLINMYRERIPEAVDEWKKTLRIVKPEVTFTGRTILFKGDKEIHLIPVGRAYAGDHSGSLSQRTAALHGRCRGHQPASLPLAGKHQAVA